MKTLTAAFGLALALGAATPVLAANARQPYANIDKRVDQGNDTGNSRVEMLNQQQLEMARGVNGTGAGPAMGQPMQPMPMQPMPMYQR